MGLRLLVASTAAIAWCTTQPFQAWADDDDFSGGVAPGGFFAEGTKHPTPVLTDPETGAAADVPAVYISLGQGACAGGSQVGTGAAEVRFCEPDEEAADVSLGAIRSAFARLDLPAGTLTIQPPDGLTLVNFDTNFYTTSTAPLTRTVTLLGRQVTIEATPDTFTWHFGDGEQRTTSDPGAAYPDLRITHNYRLKDTYRPRLATTYTGRYRLGSGAWRQIPGSVTITGEPQQLRAIEATPKLVGY